MDSGIITSGIQDAGVPAGVPEPISLEVNTDRLQVLDPLRRDMVVNFVINVDTANGLPVDEMEITLSNNAGTILNRKYTSDYVSIGEHTWEWDGRNALNVFDKRALQDGIKITVRASQDSWTQEISKELQVGGIGKDWVDVRVDHAAQTIHIDVYVDCQNEDNLDSAIFHRLKGLTLQGIGHYWSRNIIYDGVAFSVTTTAHQREDWSEDLDLYIENGADYRRSHNSGIIDASIFYNKGFYGTNTAAAEEDFEETVAHEFGHAVLWAHGGKTLSWGHKGTVNHSLLEIWNFQDPSSAATPYSSSGEIDLMRYYTGASPNNYYNRVIAAEEDVDRLILLGQVEVYPF